ncbi:SMP-30/gluconolactonase/LRE family protein [Modestobacter sp. VKM Ac-2985]|uniref:SMP-30/gluconolactonase/LRE family protein n=1 Tax=Modestobacter sp. VKM Ac-2985 TaxID=3004139 RepID=UPI0022AB67AB|nr:SMP-30/gluconolactonase/LRE family protein [Modestobacter sp. VKM Ac-2985]MCZ2839855.1 SMP-30/gluconolactonase/LRE family protein [Modestobacter sp. VKM Ac-2985]
MTTRSLTTLFTGGAFFEGPRWYDGTWWVSDFYRRTISRISTDGVEQVVAEVAGQPSGLGWLPDGTLVAVSMKDHRLLRVADGRTTELADLTEHCGGHLNDLVVDGAGRVFVGDFGFDLMGGGAARTASLKRVDPDGTVTVVAEGLQFPNGMAITPDGGTLLVDETLGNRVTAFDLSPDGSLTDRRVFAQLGPEVTGATTEEVLGQLVVAPDGCALDAEGHLWIADAVGGRAARLSPGGEVVDEVRAPEGLGVFACALGGDDGRTLLLCSAPDFYEHNRAPAREAVLLTTTVDVPHAGHS